MSFENKANVGNIWRNDKGGNERRPDFANEFALNLRELFPDGIPDEPMIDVAIWDRVDRNGNPYRYLSLSKHRPRNRVGRESTGPRGSRERVAEANKITERLQREARQGSHDLDSDLPF